MNAPQAAVAQTYSSMRRLLADESNADEKATSNEPK